MKGKSNKGNTLSKTLTYSTVSEATCLKKAKLHFSFKVLYILCLIAYAFNHVYDYYIL